MELWNNHIWINRAWPVLEMERIRDVDNYQWLPSSLLKQCLKAKTLYPTPPKNISYGNNWHMGDLWAIVEFSSKFFWFTKMCFFLTQIQERIMLFLHLWCCNSSVEMPWAIRMLFIKEYIIFQIKKGKVQKEILNLEIIVPKI